MRWFRISLLAGAGAVALTGGLIAPGIAAAAEEGSTGAVLETDQFRMTATGNDDCTVTFELEGRVEDYQGSVDTPNRRAHYRVGEEGPSMGGDGAPVYRPVLTTAERVKEAIDGRDTPYEIDLDKVTVDLRQDRVVPTNDDDVTTLGGVTPADGDSHTVFFGVYPGPGGHYSDMEEVTVTGCEDAGGGSVGGLDLFGSLSELGAGSLDGLLPEFG